MKTPTVYLIIDEDINQTNAFCDLLESIDDNIICQEAINSQTMLQVLKKSGLIPDVIFLNLNLLALEGWACLTKLKSNPNFAHIPVIAYCFSYSNYNVEIANKEGIFVCCIRPNDLIKERMLLKFIHLNLYNDLFKAIKENKLERNFRY